MITVWTKYGEHSTVMKKLI